jgi:hypothetical protein
MPALAFTINYWFDGGRVHERLVSITAMPTESEQRININSRLEEELHWKYVNA